MLRREVLPGWSPYQRNNHLPQRDLLRGMEGQLPCNRGSLPFPYLSNPQCSITVSISLSSLTACQLFFTLLWQHLFTLILSFDSAALSFLQHQLHSPVQQRVPGAVQHQRQPEQAAVCPGVLCWPSLSAAQRHRLRYHSALFCRGGGAVAASLPWGLLCRWGWVVLAALATV